MKTVKLESALTREELLETIKNFNFVNDGVLFDDKRGKPVIKVKEKGERLNITCEMVGGPSKDNGFIVGTFFSGKLTERGGKTVLRGVILTAPFYHLFMFSLIGYFIYRCITLGGFSIIPVCIAAFGFLLMQDEYKKQGIIKRYLARAFRKAEKDRTKI